MSPGSGTDAADERRRTIPREQDTPRALIALMILAMLVSVAGAYVASHRVGIAEHVLGRPAPLTRMGTIFTLDEIVAERAKANLLGRDVALWGVPAEQVTGDWLFWIGSSPERAVPVVLRGEQTGRQSERQTEVRTGDVLAVFGTVRALRDLSYLDDRLAAEREDPARLSRAQIYISASRVEHLPGR